MIIGLIEKRGNGENWQNNKINKHRIYGTKI